MCLASERVLRRAAQCSFLFLQEACPARGRLRPSANARASFTDGSGPQGCIQPWTPAAPEPKLCGLAWNLSTSPGKSPLRGGQGSPLLSPATTLPCCGPAPSKPPASPGRQRGLGPQLSPLGPPSPSTPTGGERKLLRGPPRPLLALPAPPGRSQFSCPLPPGTRDPQRAGGDGKGLQSGAPGRPAGKLWCSPDSAEGLLRWVGGGGLTRAPTPHPELLVLVT